MIKCLHLKISGQVQGVNFRYYVQQLANQLNLTGWVKNTDDGKVEMLAQGQEKNLKKLLDWAHYGPESAQVENVEFEWINNKIKFNEFKIVI